MKIKDSIIFKKDFILITSLGFIYFFIFHSFLLLPPHLANLGATEKVVGFIMGISGLSTLILTPSVGYLADKYGKKIFISCGLLVLAMSTLPFAFLDMINYLMIFLRIIHGASFSLFFIAAGALVADLSPQNKKTEAIGIYGVFTVINYAIAPFIGSIIIEKYDFKTYMIYLCIFGIAGFLLSLLLKNPLKPGVKILTAKGQSYLNYLKNKPAFISILTLFVLGAAFISTLNFISLFSLSIEVKSFYLYFVSYTATVLIIRTLFGWIPDKYGKWRVSSLAVLIFGGGILLLAFTSSLIILIVASILFGIGHGFAYPSIYTIVIESAGIGSAAKSFAIASLSFTAGGMVGLFIFGLIADYFGFRSMFVVIALFVSLIFFVFYHYVEIFEKKEINSE